MVPVRPLLLVLAHVLFAIAPSNASPSSCSASSLSPEYSFQLNNIGSGDGTLHWKVDGAFPPSTVSFKFCVNREAWLALAVSADIEMSDSDAVILLDNAVKKHWIGGYSTYSIYVLPDPQQTLTGTDFSQGSGETCMSYTRVLSTSGTNELSIDPSSDQHFIWAYGSSGTLALSHHSSQDRGSVVINLLGNSCGVEDGSNSKYIAVKAHGILMILAWTICAPSVVVVSRFGKVKLPDSKWFNAHRFLGFLIFVFSIAGYLIILSSGYEGDAKKKLHSKVGLAIIILGAIVQPLLGIFRPAKDEPDYKVENAGEPKVEMVAKDPEQTPPSPTPASSSPTPSYLTKRSLWKYCHQGVAFVCILLGFCNVLIGLNKKALDVPTTSSLRALSFASMIIFLLTIAICSYLQVGYISRVQNVLTLNHEP